MQQSTQYCSRKYYNTEFSCWYNYSNLCTFITYAISIASKICSAICAVVGGGCGHGVTKDSTIIISKQLNNSNNNFQFWDQLTKVYSEKCSEKATPCVKKFQPTL